jgi:hypothetical protein
VRLITYDFEHGVLELNYMWLPTFLGQNSGLKKYIEEMISPEVVGKTVTTQLMDDVNTRVIDIICEKYPLNGLRDYLDGIKFVDEGSPE